MKHIRIGTLVHSYIGTFVNYMFMPPHTCSTCPVT